MNNFKSLSIEYKSGALFGAIGLVLSIIIGLLTGNSIGTIVLRTLFLAVPFAVLGYGCIIILKKFVPEIYEVFGSPNIREKVKTDVQEQAENLQGNNEPKTEPESPSQDAAPAITDEPENEQVNTESNIVDEKKAKEIKSSIIDEYIDQPVKEAAKDKHIRYEPKIAAQAIRTMLKKD